jgi:hypothetical protein
MSDPTVLFQIAAAIALTVLPFTIAVRLLGGPDAADPRVRSAPLPWPAGVQEEGAVRFRLRPVV